MRAAVYTMIRVCAHLKHLLLHLLVAGSNVSGSIMMTASHMPMQNNGLKFFTAEGGLGKADITTILDSAAQKCIAARVAVGDAVSDPGYVLSQAVKSSMTPGGWPLLDLYAEHLRQMIKDGIKHPDNYDKPLTGLKIAVDAGNGSGGFFATQVCTATAASITLSD